MDKYVVVIEYEEEPGCKSMKATVNGKDTDLPRGLKIWLAEDVIRDALEEYKDQQF